MSKTVVIIEDQPVVLEAIYTAVKIRLPEHEVVNILGLNKDQILARIPDRVDVFLVDYNLGGTTGPEIIRLFAKHHRSARVIGWSEELTSEKISAFRSSGATEVTNKKSTMEEIAQLVG